MTSGLLGSAKSVVSSIFGGSGAEPELAISSSFWGSGFELELSGMLASSPDICALSRWGNDASGFSSVLRSLRQATSKLLTLGGFSLESMRCVFLSCFVGPITCDEHDRGVGYLKSNG